MLGTQNFRHGNSEYQCWIFQMATPNSKNKAYPSILQAFTLLQEAASFIIFAIEIKYLCL